MSKNAALGDKQKVLKLVERLKGRVEREMYWNALYESSQITTELLRLFDDTLKERKG